MPLPLPLPLQFERRAREMYDALDRSTQVLMDELVEIFTNHDGCWANESITRVVEILNSPNVNPNIKLLPYGQTFLYRATQSDGGNNIVRSLLDNGADPNIGNAMDGATAIDELEEMEDDGELDFHSRQLLGLLRERGALSSEQRDVMRD